MVLVTPKRLQAKSADYEDNIRGAGGQAESLIGACTKIYGTRADAASRDLLANSRITYGCQFWKYRKPLTMPKTQARLNLTA
jgi:endonuclease YncB( thermonuclease family)